MENKNFAFCRMNYILMAVSMFIIVLGFVLMSGGESTPEAYDPSIFDTRHTVIAPTVCFIGFISMIGAVMYKPKDKTKK